MNIREGRPIGQTDVYYVEPNRITHTGWYWMDYNPGMVFAEAGPFSSEAEAQQDLQEYLSK